ncbi:MAG: hypothetical protein DMD94_12970 [Candidatus Rokuibacteriota bacterium]|nr:MAG: hypothetical protein DMD94_12970 [Candidatus Rokubacteria bacterium]
MSVILVLDDDAPARAALAEQLGRLFPHVQVLTGTPAELARVEVRAASRRGAGAPPAEARRDIKVRAASRRGAGAPPAEARRDIEDGSIVLAGLADAERIASMSRGPVLRVVALTPEMGPATLMRAEAAGVRAMLRAPATAEGLRAVLEPIVGDGTPSGTEGW